MKWSFEMLIIILRLLVLLLLIIINNATTNNNNHYLFAVLESPSEVMEVELTYFLNYFLTFPKSCSGEWGSVKSLMKEKFSL